MTIKGKIISKLEIESGTSKSNKDWQKQRMIIDTSAKFNPLVCVSFFGDELVKELTKYSVGQEVEIGVNLSSREYNGNWFNDISGWNIKSMGAVASPEGPDLLPF